MKRLLIIIGVVFLCSSCVSATSVSRISSSSLTDLSGYWNNTDVKIVCDSLIKSCLVSANIMQFRIEQGRLPRIKVGTFRNDSDEHIDTGIIVNTMKVAIVNNGQAVFVADDSTQTQLREEKLDQLGNVNEDTAASIGNETGADFLLTGSVKTMVDRAGNVAERVYFVTAELTHLETGIIYWTEQNDEIKKVIQTPRVKF